MTRPQWGPFVPVQLVQALEIQPACEQVGQSQSAQAQLAQLSPPQFRHEQVPWLQLGQVQSAQRQRAHTS
ncbi:hypothetical protein [Actinopolymorpha cephalotaxi]|uniref:Uncharacterized protein n=1 Tax=Actinopolymorpha cephalotaxi TaxID=504797 RepID=A0ABX2S9L2_9ACTN|nr:hypothetical protein [Actinopolymorpha cephalotaxi]NYH85110.1 hypothetical protein [Actinopolymorpha cephalotaxi]